MNDWRERDIEALEERVRKLGETVACLLVAEAFFEFDGDDAAATETRGFAALLRARAAGYTDQARALRAAIADSDKPPALPMHVTRRVG